MKTNYNFTAKNYNVQAGSDSREFSFTGYDSDCRDGYNQFGRLVIYSNGHSVAHYEAKNHIVNRSWEAYDHQNVYMNCLSQLKDFRVNLLKDLILKGAGKQRMTKALKPALEEAVMNDEICQMCDKVYDELKK